MHLLISISVMLYDHYSIINVWLVFWFLKWEFFLNVSSKHAFFFQLLKSKFCYFVITFIYQPCVLQLDFKCFIFSLKNIANLLKLKLTSRNRKLNERDHQGITRLWLCIKVGRGQGDGDIGTRVWGLGTWGRETRDLRTSTMGRGDVWEAGDAGEAGCEWLLQKSQVNAISVTFLVNMFWWKETHPALLRVPPCLFTKRRLGEDPLH